MADILYTYGDEVYANITNKCDCNCTFCIRKNGDSVGDAQNLWHQQDPSLQEILDAMDQFDFSSYDELVFCGYGEPTCALDNLITSAKYAKEHFKLKIRLNTNGLANLYYGRDIIPELAGVIDTVSISLNAPTAEKYQAVTRPQLPNAFEGLLSFALECKKYIPDVKLTVVDVLPPEDIQASQKLADELGIFLRVRQYT
jgi:radical SAM enzyme (TIGR04100 family)